MNTASNLFLVTNHRLTNWVILYVKGTYIAGQLQFTQIVLNFIMKLMRLTYFYFKSGQRYTDVNLVVVDTNCINLLVMDKCCLLFHSRKEVISRQL